MKDKSNKNPEIPITEIQKQHLEAEEQHQPDKKTQAEEDFQEQWNSSPQEADDQNYGKRDGEIRPPTS